jgi:hypothetical protein
MRVREPGGTMVLWSPDHLWEWISRMAIRALCGPGFPLSASARINFVQNPPIFVHGFPEVDDLPGFTPIGVIKSDFFVPY